MIRFFIYSTLVILSLKSFAIVQIDDTFTIGCRGKTDSIGEMPLSQKFDH